jgi:hypothetical protein
MHFDLDLLNEEINRRSGELLAGGVASTITRGPTDRDKCAAWVDLTSDAVPGIWLRERFVPARRAA